MAINTKKYIESYLKIRTKEAKIEPFKLNAPQRKLYDAIKHEAKLGKPIRIIILKARQMGFSTLTEAILFKETATEFNISAGIVAHEISATNNLFKMSKRYYEYLPEEIKPQIQASNAKELLFDGDNGLGSSIKCMTAGNDSIGRSDTFQYLHISEYAFWKGDKESTLTGLLQAVPRTPNSLVIIESTANGYDDFKDMWDKAVAGENDFVPVFCAWWELEEYRMPYSGFELTDEEKELKTLYHLDNDQLEWRRWCIKNNCKGKVDVFHQEYPSCVTAETLVGTDKGLQRIGELKADYGTYGKILRYIENPESDIYKLTTEDGYTLRGTYEHPIFVNGECRELGSLKDETIELSIPRLADDYYTVEWEELGVKHTIKIDEKWGKFLGYFVGDGSYSCGTLSVVCDKQDRDTIEDYKALVKDLFGFECGERVVGSKGGGIEVRVGTVKLREILQNLGVLRQNCSYSFKRKVCVPPCIMKSPKSVVRAFLSALFECDGFNDYRQPRIVFFSKYKEFIDDVQLLLLACGVVSRNSSHLRHNGKGYEYMSNELNLYGWRAVAFQENVGFISKRKREKINFPKYAKSKPNTLETKVVSVMLDGREKTYNLTIDGIHEFDANGIHTHNCSDEAFLASGRAVFDNEKIAKRIEQLRNKRYKTGNFRFKWHNPETEDYIDDKSIQFVESKDGYIRLYEEPGAFPYVLGADTKGEGRDYFAATVINNHTGERVATFHAQISNSRPFTHQIYCLGKYFNNALIGVEINFNTAPIEELNRLKYPKQYVRRRYDDFTKQVEKKYGWKTDGNTRPYMIDEEINLVEENIELLNDVPTLREMLTFMYDEKGRPDAMQGKHDDLLFSEMIANRIREQQSFEAVDEETDAKVVYTDEMMKDYRKASDKDKKLLRKLWGNPFKR